jgi:hypothetical protein
MELLPSLLNFVRKQMLLLSISFDGNFRDFRELERETKFGPLNSTLHDALLLFESK